LHGGLLGYRTARGSAAADSGKTCSANQNETQARRATRTRAGGFRDGTFWPHIAGTFWVNKAGTFWVHIAGTVWVKTPGTIWVIRPGTF
jgi:hypothetical protein